MGFMLYKFLFYAVSAGCCLSAVLLLTGTPVSGRNRRGDAPAQRDGAARVRAKSGASRRHRLILTLLFAAVAAFALPRTDLLATTIGQFSDAIRAVAEQSPTALVYRESVGAVDHFAARVDDPAVAGRALDVLLNAAVDRRGCQLDMTRLQYEECGCT